MKSKTNKFLTLVLAIVASIAITSCVQDDDYTIPSSLGDEENEALTDLIGTGTEVDLAYVKALYNSDPNNDGDNDDAIPYFVEDDYYFKGYVSSSDKSGNFFKEFYLQDASSNPTGAVKIIIDQVDTYNQYNKGREVYISLKGLYIGEERTGNGITTIGGGTEFDQFGGTVTRVNENQIRTSLLRSDVTEEITPLVVTFSELSDDHVGVFVQVDNVEFSESLAGNTYFDPVQVYDTQRTMQACEGFSYTELALETSSFANFKADDLPLGNGTIKAIVNKTFDGSTRILALNAVEDVNMEATRCMPLDINDFTTSFEEDFEGFSSFTNEGWTNVNISGSSTDWFISGFNNNDYARISAFNSNNNEADVWLVTPAINLSAAANDKFLTFDLEIAYSNGIILSVYISTDFTGDPTTATWEPVNATVPFGTTNGFGGLQPIGAIDISSYDGDVNIGFFYEGSDPTATTRYHIDNLKVLNN